MCQNIEGKGESFGFWHSSRALRLPEKEGFQVALPFIGC
jgi:hypothetical protein